MIASGGLCIVQTTVGAYGSNASSTSSKRVSRKVVAHERASSRRAPAAQPSQNGSPIAATASHASAACSTSCSISSAMKSAPCFDQRLGELAVRGFSRSRLSGYARTSKCGGKHEIEPAIATSAPLASRASRAASTARALICANVAESRGFEHEAARPERVGRDHARAGVDVVAMDLAQHVECVTEASPLQTSDAAAACRGARARCRCRRRSRASRRPRGF